jgi:hypothetical protein
MDVCGDDLQATTAGYLTHLELEYFDCQLWDTGRGDPARLQSLQYLLEATDGESESSDLNYARRPGDRVPIFLIIFTPAALYPGAITLHMEGVGQLVHHW